MAALRRHWPMLLLWLAASAVLIWFSWDRIISRAGWDPDDQLRLVQLRDFLDGQSWFDSTQYRMNAPDGAPMHWSRLVELPLAFLVLLLSPLLGTDGAEMAAGAAIPLLCLGGIAFLLADVGQRIGGRAVAIVAFWLAIIAPALLIQLRPMRIDHHNWQIFCAVLGIASLYWRNERAAGLVLGAALAVWIHISLEGAPMTAAFFLYLGWRWVTGNDSEKRLFWTLCSFAGLSVLLFTGTQIQGFYAPQYCDTLSPAHVFAILGAVAVLLPATHVNPPRSIVRLALTGLGGVSAVAILLWLAPQCAQGAFGDLDPVVRSFWYDNVREGLPAWDQDPQVIVSLFTPLIVAIFGLGILWRSATPALRATLSPSAFFLIYSSVVTLLVFRPVAVATAFAIVPAAYCLVTAFNAYRTEPRLFVRLSLVPAAVLLMASGMIGSALYAEFAGDERDTAKGKIAASNAAEARDCASIASVSALGTLPPSQLVAPFNIGPAILLSTRHTVLASSHHRNREGMRDQIDLFRLPPDQAKFIVDRRALTYVVACPTDAEMTRYTKRAPNGLWAQIDAGNVPAWLAYQGTLGKGLKVWRVR